MRTQEFEVRCHEWIVVPASGASEPCSFCGSVFEQSTAKDRVREFYPTTATERIADVTSWQNPEDMHEPELPELPEPVSIFDREPEPPGAM